MIRIVASFLVGLVIGTTYPNEVRSIVRYALSYIGNAIRIMQETLSNQEYPTTSQGRGLDYNQLKIDNQDIAKKLDPDWK